MPIDEVSFGADKMTTPSSSDTKMEIADSAETAVAEDLDMNLDSFKISSHTTTAASASNKQQPDNTDADSHGHQSHSHSREQQHSHAKSPSDEERGGQYEHEQPQRQQPSEPEPRLESLSRLALALAQEEEDAKQGSNHDRYLDRRGDPSGHDDDFYHHHQHLPSQQQPKQQQRGSPSSPAAHSYSYSDRETASSATHDGHPSQLQSQSYPSSSPYSSSSQQPPHPHAPQDTYTRHTQPQQRQLPPLSPAQQPLSHLPPSSPSPTSAHGYSSSSRHHSRYPPTPNSASSQYPYPRHAYGGELNAHATQQPRRSVSDEGSDSELAAQSSSSPYQHHHHHQQSPHWSRLPSSSSASYHFHPRSSSPQRSSSSYRSPPASYPTPHSSGASFSGSSDPYRSAYDHSPSSGPYKSQQQPPTTMPVSPPIHPRHSYGSYNINSNNSNSHDGPLPALAPRPSHAYADDRSPRSGPHRPASPNHSPRSSLDSRSSSGMKHYHGKESIDSPGSFATTAMSSSSTLGATAATGSNSGGGNGGGGSVVIQSARGTPKGPLPIEVQIKLLRSVLQHDPFNCAIRKTTHAWESISREQGIRARTCARRFDNIIQAYIAGRDKPVGTEEQQRIKRELLEKLFEMMNQPQALKRMQKKRRYRSEESDRRLLLETIRLNPFAQKVGQVAKAWEDIRDALNMKVHARQCIRRVNRMVKPYLLRERMYRGNIPEEMREANDDLIKQVIQLMKQAGNNQLDDEYMSNASSHEDSASGMSESEDEDLACDDAAQEGNNPRVKRRAASAEEDELLGCGEGARGEDDDEEMMQMKDQQSESERHHRQASRHSRQSSLPLNSQQGSPRLGNHRSSSSQRSFARRGRSRTATLSNHSGGAGDARPIRGEDYRNNGPNGPPSTSQSSTVVTPTTPSFPSNSYDDNNNSHDYRYSSSKYPSGAAAANPTLPSPSHHPAHSSPSYPPSSSSHYYYPSSTGGGVVSPTRSSAGSDSPYPRWPPNPAHFIDVDGNGYRRPIKHARADSHGSRFQLSEGSGALPNQVPSHSQPQQQQSSSHFAMPKPVFKNEQGQDMRYAHSSAAVSQHLQQPRPIMYRSPMVDRYDSAADRQSRPIQLSSTSAPSPALSTRAMDLDHPSPGSLPQPHGYHPPQPHPQQQQQYNNSLKPNFPQLSPHAQQAPGPHGGGEEEGGPVTTQQYREMLDELSSIKYTLRQFDQQRRQDMEVQQRMAQMIEDLQRQLHATKGH